MANVSGSALRSANVSTNVSTNVSSNTLINGLNPEQFALFKAGFLQCGDGSLLRWAPNQDPDPLVVGMMGLQINEKQQQQSQEQSQQSPLKIETAKRACKR